MSDNEDTFKKAVREKREFTDRAIEQIAKTQNVSPFMFTGGTLTHDAITHLASSLARVERTLSREPVAHDSRDLMIDDLIQRVDRQARRIDSLELDIAALRSVQQFADPTGAHPYRSATQTVAAPASSPVTTSDALGRPETSPGILRRVYGALASRWPVTALVACGSALLAIGVAVDAYRLVALGGLLLGPSVPALIGMFITEETCA